MYYYRGKYTFFIILLFFIIGINSSNNSYKHCVHDIQCDDKVECIKKSKSIIPLDNLIYGFSDIIVQGCTDLLDIFKNIFTIETIEILGFTTPFYIIARTYDHKIHRFFYDRKRHKNIRQLPKCLYKASSAILGTSLGIATLLALFPWDYNIERTSRVFLFGLPLTGITKYIIKKSERDFCKRPRNEDFDKHKIFYGGFPSGHTMEMVYMTTVFGLQYGYKAGIPLTAATLYIATDFIIKNRHYLSQILAGAIIGLIYGVSANKVINKSLDEYFKNVKCKIVNQDNFSGLNLSYKF